MPVIYGVFLALCLFAGIGLASTFNALIGILTGQ